VADNVYASMTWQPRWNGAEAVAALTTNGADVMATGFFGVLRFRMDDDASVAAIVRHARAFADMVEHEKLDRDTAWMASAPADDRNSLD